MTAAEIARALGAGHRSGRWWSCRCLAHDDRSPSQSLRDGDHGLIVHCWAGCDPRDILAELRRLGLIAGRVEDRPPPVPVRGGCSDDIARRVALARGIWNAAREARASPLARYLLSRGITTIPSPASLRWAPGLRRPDGTNAPAMVARIDGPDGALMGLHRTWLRRDASGQWHRLDRRMLGRAAGGAVRLDPAAETLMVGEGIETCLSAMQATPLPAWAALSTSGLKALALPPIVRTVIILADNDPNGAGERAALAAASRWIAEGRRVRIAMPPEPGTDFNDVFAGHAYAQVTETPVVAA